MAKSDELLLARVQKAWASYRNDAGVSQAKAAKALGMNQSAFSQYLRGAIPLNTDFLMRFGKLTAHDMGDAIEEISATSRMRAVTLPIKYTLSGAEREGRLVVESLVPSGDCYLVENDYPTLPLRKGDYFIVDPDASVCSGSLVFVRFSADIPPTIGELSYVNNDWVLLEDRAMGGRRLNMTKVVQIDLLVGTYHKPAVGRTFKS